MDLVTGSPQTRTWKKGTDANSQSLSQTVVASDIMVSYWYTKQNAHLKKW